MAEEVNDNIKEETKEQKYDSQDDIESLEYDPRKKCIISLTDQENNYIAVSEDGSLKRLNKNDIKKGIHSYTFRSIPVKNDDRLYNSLKSKPAKEAPQNLSFAKIKLLVENEADSDSVKIGYLCMNEEKNVLISTDPGKLLIFQIVPIRLKTDSNDIDFLITCDDYVMFNVDENDVMFTDDEYDVVKKTDDMCYKVKVWKIFDEKEEKKEEIIIIEEAISDIITNFFFT
eukprot:77490_1